MVAIGLVVSNVFSATLSIPAQARTNVAVEQASASATSADVDGTMGGGWSLQDFRTPPFVSTIPNYDTSFGNSVDIWDDYLVVSAGGDTGDADSTLESPNTNGGALFGAAYVYWRDSGTWETQALLKASNGGVTDSFGTAVAISNDTIVVGAYQEDGDSSSTLASTNENAAGAGAAYVYVGDGSDWTQQAYLKASNAASNANFGRSVDIDGDTIIVGADGASTSAGRAYIYTRSGTTWTEQAILSAEDGAGNNDKFGMDVAIDGDTAVVGAYNEDGSITSTQASPNNLATNSGAVYVFVRSGSTWTLQAYLKASNAEAQDYFGLDVDISGDTIIVGAYGEDGSSSSTAVSPDNTAAEAGAAYIFTRSGTTWTQQAYLKPSSLEAGDRFGDSVAVSGDIAAVQASRDDGSITSTLASPNNLVDGNHATYVFQRSGGNWTASTILKSPNGYSNTNGKGVAINPQGDTIVQGATNVYDQRIACSSAREVHGGGAAIYVLGAGDARLSNLQLSNSTALTSTRDGGGFVPYNGCYEATVARESTVVSPTTVAAGATVSARVSAPSGAGRQTCTGLVCPLQMGANFITVTVVSTDSLISRWYRVLTTRTVSTDADLIGLGASVGVSSPAFSSTTTAYTITVPAGTTSATLAATKSHSLATVAVSAPCDGSLVCTLSTLPTVVTLTVTAEDATTTKRYVVAFVRGAAPQQVWLSDLTVMPGDPMPAFVSSTTAYAVEVEGAAVITLTGTPQPPTATVTYESAAGACTGGVCPIGATGTTLVTATVTSADGTATKNYVVGAMMRPDVHRANVTKIAQYGNAAHTCALLKDGQVLCWGMNDYGQLGIGTKEDISVPITMTSMTDAVDVAPGRRQTCVLREGGRVQCAGTGENYALGNGQLDESLVLTDVLEPDGSRPLEGATAIEATAYGGCVIRGGQVLCWGTHFYDESWNPILTSTLPVTIEGITSAVELVAQNSSICVLESAGAVRCWGKNGSGQLGIGLSYGDLMMTTTINSVLDETRTGSLGGVVDISGGANSGNIYCAVKQSGDLLCWGNNSSGQLADGQFGVHGTAPITPTYLGMTTTAIGDVAEVHAGDYFVCARTASGMVTCAGDSQYGRLGTGTIKVGIDREDASGHVTVTRYFGGPPLTDVVQIGGSDRTTCALQSDGDVMCWGATEHGRLGNGSTETGQYSGEFDPVWVIRPALSDDAMLAELAIAPGVLMPAFVSTTMEYTAEVPFGTTSAAVTATTNHVDATVAYTSTAGACTPNDASPSNCAIAASGATTITITITAADLTTTETYTVVVTAAPSNDATLADLQLDAPAVLQGTWVSSTLRHTITADAAVMSFTFWPTVTSVRYISATSSAGFCNLTYVTGQETGRASCKIAPTNAYITVTVTAADGTTMDYLLVVNPYVAPPDATLADLAIAPGALTPAFVSSTTQYAAEVPSGTTSVAVTATTNDVSATIAYASTAGACTSGIGRVAARATGPVVGWATDPVAPTCAIAATGATTITITITAPDLTTTETYTIVVTVAEPTPLTTIDRVWPGTGLEAGGMPVQIFGSGFAAALTVTVDGASVPFTIVDDGRIDFVMPPGTAGTSVDVVVATANGSVTAADAFTYVTPDVIVFDGEVGGVFTTTDGVVVTIPPQGVSGSFYLTMTPQPPAPGVPGNILMYAFRLDAVWNGIELATLTNPVTIQLPIDENIFAIQDGERPWLYQWVGGEERGERSEEREEEGSALFSLSSSLTSSASGRWVLVRGQAYEPTTRVMTVALRPMGEYALSTAILRSYWFPVVPTLR
jgi:alpha-tubulin suppressor-like RCC1 family protein